MKATTTGSPPAQPLRRRLGALGQALDRRLDRLQSEYLAGSPHARADLAKLRRALGKAAGSVPEVWQYTVETVPESLQWDRDEPSRAEQATHAALTLFALHQQSMPGPAHVPGVSFGRAARRLARGGERSEEAVTRRFMAVATATTIDEVLVHVRGLVTQLRSQNQGFDYARLGDDILGLLTPQRAERVRLSWGRDFYRNISTDSDTTDTAETSQKTKE